jgi:hypothetical protein
LNIGAFESFLEDFKSSPEQAIAYSLENIDLDNDDLSDEYDFLEDDEEHARQRRRDKARSRVPERKYKVMLQKLADRQIDEVVIDLDDMATVRRCSTTRPWVSIVKLTSGTARTTVQRKSQTSRFHRGEYETLR